jgi:hypothetical protein
MATSKSLAGSEQTYVVIQGRVVGNNIIHIQGAGVEGNRPYGVATDIAVAPALADWLYCQARTELSLADGSIRRYTTMQARLDGDAVKVQVAGDPFNRAYGAMFRVIDVDDLTDWLIKMNKETEQMTFTTTKSLAGTDTQYVTAQARVKQDGQLHIQVRGPEGNRPYGFSSYADVPADVADWLHAQFHWLPSLAAGSNKLYVAMQVRTYDEGIVRVQVPGYPTLNRKYGATFTIEDADLAAYLSSPASEEEVEEVEDSEEASVTEVASLAGSSKLYVQLQARATGPATIHVQGRGPEGNRDYGISTDIEVSPDFAAWLANQESLLPSLAGSAEGYTPVQARLSGGRVKFQVAGTPFTRSYGAEFKVVASDLADWLAAA